MSTPRLTNTSFIVLGLLARLGKATPYDLKQAVAASIGNFWSVQHSQLYSEPERLAKVGLLEEERERTGRRRRLYRLTVEGRCALDEWLATPTDAFTELRDPGLLQLWFGADPKALAEEQLAVHERQLACYEELRKTLASSGMPDGVRLTLESGIGHEREWVRFWKELAGRQAAARVRRR